MKILLIISYFIKIDIRGEILVKSSIL